MTDPIEYADKPDEDIMHFNQDMQKLDKAEFFRYIIREVNCP